ncbi:hypothetical protein [Lentilactobacillus kisonensis]|uniref:RES domain-containing protein n=1 Tax=Lentilactobacillus kisonensis F0435 TaxID=797516 RepID=H1LKC0_9LACO|nr:hypothetical protein [Lentilactobacillus kisonensis]EHO47594.1 hypothetical protein HMPREF9104_03066 [Lentilactobacillus kisonensis F0435]
MTKQTIFHATTTLNWRKIHGNGFKVPQPDWAHFYQENVRKKPGSLGYGLYGYLNDAELAKQFLLKATGSKEYVIIKLTVNVMDENSLNFVSNIDDMMLFRRFLLRPRLQGIIDNLRTIYHNSFKQHGLDGALIELFIRRLEKRQSVSNIDCVICATTTDLYRIHVFIPNGIEYCIRNKMIISNYELE